MCRNRVVAFSLIRPIITSQEDPVPGTWLQVEDHTRGTIAAITLRLSRTQLAADQEQLLHQLAPKA